MLRFPVSFFTHILCHTSDKSDPTDPDIDQAPRNSNDPDSGQADHDISQAPRNSNESDIGQADPDMSQAPRKSSDQDNGQADPDIRFHVTLLTKT